MSKWLEFYALSPIPVMLNCEPFELPLNSKIVCCFFLAKWNHLKGLEQEKKIVHASKCHPSGYPIALQEIDCAVCPSVRSSDAHGYKDYRDSRAELDISLKLHDRAKVLGR